MTIRTEGSDAVFGCPCCPSCMTTFQFQKQYFIPPKTGGRISQNELDRILKEANEILHNSHFPLLPLIFTHFIFFFLPFVSWLGMHKNEMSIY
jgi:hypothetical protein